MNRLTRITSILIHLQSKRVITAAELAKKYEVSLRTIYRDIDTLQQAGVPIGSENGVGYFIVQGYFLPPVSFSQEEANALITSEQFILNQGDTSLINGFREATTKIKAVLKSAEKDSWEKMQHRVRPSKLSDVPESNWLTTVQLAIAKNKVLHISYESLSKQEKTERTIEPLGVYFTQKAWVMVAYCRLRNDLREFRLDKINELKVTDERFKGRPDFSFTDYFQSLST